MKRKLSLLLCSMFAVVIHPLYAQDIMVSGAGTTNANGIYVENGTYEGKPKYERTDGDGTLWVIRWDCFESCYNWHIFRDNCSPSGCFDPYYFCEAAESNTPPSTDWVTSWLGQFPAPSVGPAGPALTYSSPLFREGTNNDGSFDNSITITHNGIDGNTFTGTDGEDFVATGKAVVTNVPAGLTASIVRVSATEATFSLVGNATVHTNANDLFNLTVTFADAAFSGGVATAVTNYQKSDLEIDFIQFLTVASSGADFTTITDAIAAADHYDEIHLADETFTEVNITVNKTLTFRGEGADQTIIQAHAAANAALGGVFIINYPAEVVTFHDLTIRHGYLTGIHQSGAGIDANNATLYLYNCAVVDNKVNVSGNGNGGGIFASSNMYLYNCLIANNTNHTTSTGGMADGGGIFGGNVYIENTTFSGNANTRASGTNSRGGALICDGGSIINSTFTNNICAGTGGGISVNYGDLSVTNTIVFGNTANSGDNVYRNGGTLDVTNSIFGASGAYSGSTINGTNVNVSSTDPLLAALADNGGTTQTHALGAGSPAIDAGVNGVADTDQNGFYRNGNRDIGAHENGGFPTWKGGVSTDWNVAANWGSGAVPTASDDVYIMANAVRNAHVTANPATCNNLTIGAGARLIIDAGKALTVSGATTNEGTILIKANATGMGSFIDNGTVSGSGAFQMEQYLTGANNAGTPNGRFYYVGSGVVGATAADYNIASGTKLWSYSEAGNGYTQITDGSTTLLPLAGLTVRAGSSGSVTQTGTSFNTGTQSASLSRTGTSNSKRGYHLVSNPYPSTVNWDGATRTNLESTIWYRASQGGTMVFDTYNANGSVGTNNNLVAAVTGDIPPGQAVWVRVNADGNTGELSFSNANRSHGTLTSIYKTEAQEGLVRMTLSNGTNSDETILLFDTDALDGFDDYDSRKYWSSNVLQVYTNVAEDTLTINGLYNTTTNPVVDLGVKLPLSGEYSLNANSITLVGETVFLEDKMLSIFQDLNAEPNYAFTSTNGNIADRFALHFGMSITDIEDGVGVSSRVYTSNGNQLNIILSDNISNGNVEVLDMTGRVVYTSNLNASRSTFNVNTASGVYLVRVETTTGVDAHKILMK